jgi:hypothetical protein
MKIKVNFITNHSGSNMDAVVDNPVLLEILQRYKDLGVFGDSRDLDFHIGFIDPDAYIDWESYGQISKTPAFMFFSGERGSETSRIEICPDSLDDVLAYIISVMDADTEEFSRYYDTDLYSQMKQELLERQQEIKVGYRKVLWDTDYYLEGPEIGDPEKAHFSYDPDNGEKFEAQYYEGD